MDLNTPTYYITAGIVILIILSIDKYFKRQKLQKILWNKYQQALLNGDKKKALNAGRLYYSSLRKGKLTVYDEQAINNDITAMK